jgi:hypothetical protein
MAYVQWPGVVRENFMPYYDTHGSEDSKNLQVRTSVQT